MFTPELNILFAFVSSIIITLFIIPKVIIVAQQLRLIDLAGQRSSHKGSVPIFGGIAIFLGFICSLLFWSEIQNLQYIFVALLIVFFTGIIDDLVSLSPLKKLFGQTIAVLIIIYLNDLKIDNMCGVLGIFELPDIVSLLFTIFVTIVIINSFNLIDGIDGLAAGVGIISSSCFGALGLLMGQFDMSIIAFSLSGALIGFLRYNFHPARIFMGDTGSMVVGMVLSILAINIIKEGFLLESLTLPNKGPLVAISLLALPLFDSLRVFVNRVRKGKNPFSAGRDHLHHAFLDLGYSHRKTALTLYLIAILLILCSFYLLESNLNISITILAFVSYITFFIPFYILRKRL